MGRERNTDVVVTTFLYWNYLPVPTFGIELNENIYGEYVPWGQSEVTYFPLSEEAYASNEQQWEGWHKTGITMDYRPNYFHGGYIMPHLSTWQVAEFFQFAYRHGMIGFDQDSLHGHRSRVLMIHSDPLRHAVCTTPNGEWMRLTGTSARRGGVADE